MSEVITFEADMHHTLAEDWDEGQKEEYARHVFKAHTEGNPNYTSVGDPVITFHDDVRDGFLTAKIAFEVERA